MYRVPILIVSLETMSRYLFNAILNVFLVFLKPSKA